jgi:hypothetical protein
MRVFKRQNISKNLSRKTAAGSPAQNKKEQGEKPCSENCVDPFVSPKIGFDLD